MRQLSKTLTVVLMFWAAMAIATAAPVSKNAVRRTPVRPAATASKPVAKKVVRATAVRKPAVRKPMVRYSSSYRYSSKSKTAQRYSSRSTSRRTVANRYVVRRGGRRVIASSHYTRVGQQAPTPERITEIQRALADKGYLMGDLDGKWEARTTDALKRFQADQSLTADGRLSSMSLIALGLGPNRTNMALARMQNSSPTALPAAAATPSFDAATTRESGATFGLNDDLRDLQ